MRDIIVDFDDIKNFFFTKIREDDVITKKY